MPDGHSHGGMPSGMGGMQGGMMPAKPASGEHHHEPGTPAHND
jgi:hypothetical protein